MIYRGRLENIIFEFSLAENPFCNVILCEGLPSVPKQKELMALLSNNGCNVFFPRYSGTWESDGEFLSKSPADDIYTFFQYLKRGTVTELFGNKTFNVDLPTNLVGSSFGGTVALSLLAKHDIHKIVALSPIVDFSSHNSKESEQDLYWLKTFIQNAFGFAYRFNDRNWDAMLKGELFNPPQEIQAGREKDVLIVYDTTDKEVNPNKISQYAENNKIETVVTHTMGHLGLSKIPEELWQKIFSFFKK